MSHKRSSCLPQLRARLSCSSGLTLCGGDAGLAYCANLKTENTNCGACGRACGSGQACSAGACVVSCPPGQSSCTTSSGVGYCASLLTDDNNCGACGRSCGALGDCTSGSCVLVCPSGQSACSGGDASAPYCANLQTDAANCGQCARACSGGASCQSGVCQAPCASGLTYCSGKCVNLQTDASNCGSCGKTCASSPYLCSGGVCSTATRIVMGACNSAYLGNMGGTSGADALCDADAQKAGKGTGWRAVLSTSARNVKDLFTGAVASLPVYDLRGILLYSSWSAVFSGSSWSSSVGYMPTFNGRWVDESQGTPNDWYDADGWHGSNTNGTVYSGETCSDWTTSSSLSYGRKGEWDSYTLLGQEQGVCNVYQALMCVKAQ